jgi:hypothetical protein
MTPCIHPRAKLVALARESVGTATVFWCSECGALAGVSGEPRVRPISWTEGPPPLAFIAPERAP